MSYSARRNGEYDSELQDKIRKSLSEIGFEF